MLFRSATYVVLKIPRWPFDKFVFGDRKLGTQMKATGEVMAIDRSFEAAFLKSIRCLDLGITGLRLPAHTDLSGEKLEEHLRNADDERMFMIAEAFERGLTIDYLAGITHIDRYFLKKIKNILDFSKQLRQLPLDLELLQEAKKLGFSDKEIADLKGKQESDICDLRRRLGIIPTYKQVDTCAGEFEAQTP